MIEPYAAARDAVLARFEAGYLVQLLALAGGNVSKAARIAEIDRTTLYRMMERHKVVPAEIRSNIRVRVAANPLDVPTVICDSPHGELVLLGIEDGKDALTEAALE